MGSGDAAECRAAAEGDNRSGASSERLSRPATVLKPLLPVGIDPSTISR
jgi:hypothetical protein